MKHVLMVDDEEDLVWSTGKQMSRERSDLSFEGITDPEEALTLIRRQPPDVLITDVRMPKMTGIELMMAARAVAPALPVVVVTAYGSADVRAEVHRSPSVEYLEKPFSFQSLSSAVDRVLARPANGFSGAISLPMLPDLIQIYALSRATGALRIRRGPEEGGVWFSEGEIIHATCGSVRGEEAVYALLRWQGGEFQMEAGAQPPERSVGLPWQELLVEGCRLMDEAQRSEAVTPAAADPFASLRSSLPSQPGERGPETLVLGLSLRDDASAVLLGATEGGETEWRGPVSGLIEDARRLTGGSGAGAFEGLSREIGFGLAWDDETSRAVVFVERLGSQNRASRFRSSLARWLEAWQGPQGVDS